MVNTPIPHSLKSEAKKAAKILREFTMPNSKTGPDKLIPGKHVSFVNESVCVHVRVCVCIHVHVCPRIQINFYIARAAWSNKKQMQLSLYQIIPTQEDITTVASGVWAF